MNIDHTNNKEADIEKINQPSSSHNPTRSNFSRQFSIHNLKNHLKRKKNTLDTNKIENPNIELKIVSVTTSKQTNENAHPSTSFDVSRASTSVSNNTALYSEIQTQSNCEENTNTVTPEIPISYTYPKNFFTNHIKYLQCNDKLEFYERIEMIFLIPLIFLFTCSVCNSVPYLTLKCSVYSQIYWHYIILWICSILNIFYLFGGLYFYIKTKLHETTKLIGSMILISSLASIIPLCHILFVKSDVVSCSY